MIFKRLLAGAAALAAASLVAATWGHRPVGRAD